MSFLDSINPLKAISSLFKGIKSFTGSNDLDRMNQLKEMTTIDNKLTMKILDWKMSMEKNGNWFTRSVRPMIAYTFLALFILSKFGYVDVFTLEDQNNFQNIVLFYFGLRSTEKIVKSLKEMK